MGERTTTDSASGNRIFISCVSDEFEKPGAPFPGLRGRLRHYLTRADCEVKVQEDFRQTEVDTVQKLDGYIRRCAAVIHLVGEMPGAKAHPDAVRAYLTAEPRFLESFPDLRSALNDCSDLTYTQWEAFIALYHRVPLYGYATDGAAAAQAAHLNRLQQGRRHAEPISGVADLLGKLIGDIHDIIPAVPKLERKIAPSRILRHAPRRLFGRDEWLDELDAAWSSPAVNVYSLIAWGGAGKTAVVAY